MGRQKKASDGGVEIATLKHEVRSLREQMIALENDRDKLESERDVLKEELRSYEEDQANRDELEDIVIAQAKYIGKFCTCR